MDTSSSASGGDSTAFLRLPEWSRAGIALWHLKTTRPNLTHFTLSKLTDNSKAVHHFCFCCFLVLFCFHRGKAVPTQSFPHLGKSQGFAPRSTVSEAHSGEITRQADHSSLSAWYRTRCHPYPDGLPENIPGKPACVLSSVLVQNCDLVS